MGVFGGALLLASCGGLVEVDLPIANGESDCEASSKGCAPVEEIHDRAEEISSEEDPEEISSEEDPVEVILADADGSRHWREGCPKPRWVHEHYLDPEGTEASMSEGDKAKLRIHCELGGDAHCNRPQEDEVQQWAALSVYFGEPGRDPDECFDLSVFQGIQFDMYPLGIDDAFHVEMATDHSRPASGGGAHSLLFVFLDNDPHRIDLDFDEFVRSDGEVGFDARFVQRVSFVVRERLPDEETGIEIVRPYEQLFDKILLYTSER